MKQLGFGWRHVRKIRVFLRGHSMRRIERNSRLLLLDVVLQLHGYFFFLFERRTNLPCNVQPSLHLLYAGPAFGSRYGTNKKIGTRTLTPAGKPGMASTISHRHDARRHGSTGKSSVSFTRVKVMRLLSRRQELKMHWTSGKLCSDRMHCSSIGMGAWCGAAAGGAASASWGGNSARMVRA
jgi:hypothetical protein